MEYVGQGGGLCITHMGSQSHATEGTRCVIAIILIHQVVKDYNLLH
jgi:hypothetical protein